MRIHRTGLAVGLLIGLLAGCGQSPANTGVASLKDGATPGASASASASADPRAFAQCMRDNGVDMPDPGPDGTFGELPKTTGNVEKALQACRSLAPAGDIDPTDPEVQEALRQFAGCMRANGVDMPDPDPASGRIAMEGLNRSDPKVLKAFDACRDKLSPLTGGK
ncbi:hypothetical protein GCM10009555_005020 [Acrocarpospora macrocephala]|uniref:Lipoprotein n=1 Tax=Acrocarpospora macrocephala TaxID=150177 RepID=A0A5M3WX05_9ACTN|nr:hypothetical protein [Acrocarpospora macrocephala]GES13290.1 hypothetical protein Amac_068870 [Acrocarpospora macrocephala]